MTKGIMKSHTYIACDLGAESGRVILGTLAEGRLTLEEQHRFPTGPVSENGSLFWDISGIFEALTAGLTQAAATLAAAGQSAESVSVDSWGVDYALVSPSLEPVARAYHYRDPRTGAAYAQALETVPAETIFAETGIQFMPINTLYQLLAHAKQEPHQLTQADGLLLIADYVQALLSGVGRAERSLASTTQLYSPVTGEWSAALLSAFDLPAALLPPLVDSGTVLGPLRPEIAAQTGLGPEPPVQVIATCSHDTGAAVAAVPEEGDDWAYLSSGTWSLLGVELPAPLISKSVRAANFTNEVGYGGSIRFLKNIAGLWIIQECRRAWRAEGMDISYEALMGLAETAEPFRSLLQPGDARFVTAGEMPRKVRDFCRETGQPVPDTPGQIVRCALESLALSYRQTLEQIEALTGRDIRRLHIVGGGSQSALLNQFAACATGRSVLAGPVEATAIGNVLLQAVALGHLDGLTALRQTVRDSFSIQHFSPTETAAWPAAYEKFQTLETP